MKQLSYVNENNDCTFNKNALSKSEIKSGLFTPIVPKKWVVLGGDKLSEFFKGLDKNLFNGERLKGTVTNGCYTHMNKNKWYCTTRPSLSEDTVLLTFEEYMDLIYPRNCHRYTIKDNCRIYLSSVEKIAGRPFHELITDTYGDCPAINQLRDAGVLDIWFDADYELQGKLFPVIGGIRGLYENKRIRYGDVSFTYDELRTIIRFDGLIGGITLKDGYPVTMKELFEIEEVAHSLIK